MTAEIDVFDVSPTQPIAPITADPHREGASGTDAGGAHDLPKKKEAGGGVRTPPETLSKEQIQTAVDRLREQVEAQTTRLEFDLESGEQLLVVRDKENGEVVRTFPAEELRQLKERLDEFAAHLLDLVV